MDHAARQRDAPHDMDGFISVERFQSLTDCRLRVAAVVRDYGMTERREQAPVDGRIAHGG